MISAGTAGETLESLGLAKALDTALGEALGSLLSLERCVILLSNFLAGGILGLSIVNPYQYLNLSKLDPSLKEGQVRRR